MANSLSKQGVDRSSPSVVLFAFGYNDFLPFLSNPLIGCFSLVFPLKFLMKYFCYALEKKLQVLEQCPNEEENTHPFQKKKKKRENKEMSYEELH